MAVNTGSHHEVTAWVRSKIAAGTFKNCGHLEVSQDHTGRDGVVFTPNCTRSSFEFSDRRLSQIAQFDALIRSLHTDPISCPKNCVNYVSARRVKFNRPFLSLWAARRYLLVPFQWFGKLPWQTQVLLIMLLIIALTPKWVPQMIALLKAFHG
jgi:hypothetical protein